MHLPQAPPAYAKLTAGDGVKNASAILRNALPINNKPIRQAQVRRHRMGPDSSGKLVQRVHLQHAGLARRCIVCRCMWPPRLTLATSPPEPEPLDDPLPPPRLPEGPGGD
jgi:hypothetical protein